MFSYSNNLNNTSFVEWFLSSVFGPNLEPGTPLLCQGIQVPPWILLVIWIQLPNASFHSSFCECFSLLRVTAVSEIVVYLIPNTIPQRAPMKTWEPSKGKFCSRQWSRMGASRPQHVTHHSLSDLPLLHSSCRGPQDPTDFWKCHFSVSLLRGGKTQPWILTHIKTEGFSFHVMWKLLSFLKSEVCTNEKLRIKPDTMVIYLNSILGSTDEKGKGDSITEHIQTATPKALGVKNIELFLMRLMKVILILCSFNSSYLNLLSPMRN